MCPRFERPLILLIYYLCCSNLRLLNYQLKVKFVLQGSFFALGFFSEVVLGSVFGAFLGAFGLKNRLKIGAKIGSKTGPPDTRNDTPNMRPVAASFDVPSRFPEPLIKRTSNLHYVTS